MLKIRQIEDDDFSFQGILMNQFLSAQAINVSSRTHIQAQIKRALILSLLVAGCAHENEQTSRVNDPLVDQKYILSADRAAFEQLRQDIPEEKRVENDEIAFSLQMMSGFEHSPSKVREKFNSALSKKRTSLQKDLQKSREEFVKNERKSREEFQKNQEKTRKEFLTTKPTAEQRKEFFDQHDLRRRDYNAKEKEARDEFESKIRDLRKNFDDYALEKTSEFNQKHREYSRQYEEEKKKK